jgi:UDP-glucose 4-epimerase
MTAAWIIGARGMLGSAMVREMGHRAGWTVAKTDPLPWVDGADAVRTASALAADRLVAAADGGPWAVIWTAGAAVTASNDEQVEVELEQLEAALDGMRSALEARSGGMFFYASSAGGVYAGSDDPPFTEASRPQPISPYGRLKLRSEVIVAEFARTLGAPSLIGRFANIYGPGQRLDKMQGLISHIALTRLTASAASIYVPLDTLRDYIYVDDGARLALDALERLAVEGGSVTKILASGQSTTIGALLGHFRAISKARPRVVLGTSSIGARQAHDLRLRSTVWPDLDVYRATTLPEGIRASIADIEWLVREGRH